MVRASDDARDVNWRRGRERLTTELRFVLRNHGWKATPEIVDAIVDWQIRAVTAARTDSWIPGMAGSRDPIVKDVLSRFYTYRMGTAVGRLIDENSALKRQLLDALDCIRFYAQGAADGGIRAKTALVPLLDAEPPNEDTGIIPNFLETWSQDATHLAD
jgi:hypothetical protein